jgi:hypothetical protein
MTRRRTRITLIQHPTVALHVSGFADPELSELGGGVYLGHTYERVMPSSLLRVASVLGRHPGLEIDILDLRLNGAGCREICRTVDWGRQYKIRVERVGSPFALCDERIERSDWIGLSSHFTFEAGVVRDMIRYIRKRKPRVKIMVGGADVKARPRDYLRFGADLAFMGDADPNVLSHYKGGSYVVAPRPSRLEEAAFPAFDKLAGLQEYSGSYDGAVPEGVGAPIGFMHLSRGCPRECDFCEARRTKFERLSLEKLLAVLEWYRRAGIRSINFTDDNLLLVAGTPSGRQELIEFFRVMRRMRFAWEFPIGLEIGRFIKDGRLDEELMEAMFDHSVDAATGEWSGAYRMYVPLETFERREQYRKLRSAAEQNRVLAWLGGAGLPEMDFGVVLPPSATPETFAATRDGYLRVKELVKSRGATRTRYGAFHLIPIALFRDMKTTYPMDEFPEAWNIYFPNYDGAHFTGPELFEMRLKLIKAVDRSNYSSMQLGQYTYG